jgi:hypothetical protein
VRPAGCRKGIGQSKASSKTEQNIAAWDAPTAPVALVLHYQKRNNLMPGKKHLRGVSGKEQRQYEHILSSARKSGRYGKRAKEVAARTVMKEHKRKGHAKGR